MDCHPRILQMSKQLISDSIWQICCDSRDLNYTFVKSILFPTPQLTKGALVATTPGGKMFSGFNHTPSIIIKIWMSSEFQLHEKCKKSVTSVIFSKRNNYAVLRYDLYIYLGYIRYRSDYSHSYRLSKINFGWNVHHSLSVNTLRPSQTGHHFPDDIFKFTFMNENIWIDIKTSLKLVPKGPFNNIVALVQIMAWCRPGDKPLSEAMIVSSLTHICVTRPQWSSSTRTSSAFICQ